MKKCFNKLSDSELSELIGGRRGVNSKAVSLKASAAGTTWLYACWEGNSMMAPYAEKLKSNATSQLRREEKAKSSKGR